MHLMTQMTEITESINLWIVQYMCVLPCHQDTPKNFKTSKIPSFFGSHWHIIMYPLAVREILKNLMNNPELNRTEWSNNKFLTKFFFMEVININHFNDFVSIENYIMFFESNAKFANKYTCKILQHMQFITISVFPCHCRLLSLISLWLFILYNQ